MSWFEADKIKSLLLELVNQPSISGTKQEVTMGKKIHQILSRIDYFKNNPEHLFLKIIEGDKHNRNFVSAYLEGNGNSNKTVVLVSHFDIVDVLDYGEYKDLAFKPEELTEKLREFDPNDPVKYDYALFGLGVFEQFESTDT